MNSRYVMGVIIACAGLALLYQTTLAAHPPTARPSCEPGYTIVEEIQYREVVRRCCKVVPEVKKTTKWVYGTKDDAYCLPKLRLLQGGACTTCTTPQCRQLLVKKPVVHGTTTYKCVIEEVIEKVPYTVCHKVPISAAPCEPYRRGHVMTHPAHEIQETPSLGAPVITLPIGDARDRAVLGPPSFGPIR